MTDDEPTPIGDASLRLAALNPLYPLAAATIITTTGVYLGSVYDISWLEAGGSLSTLIFMALAIGIVAYRRFKRWRYPSYYDTETES